MEAEGRQLWRRLWEKVLLSNNLMMYETSSVSLGASRNTKHGFDTHSLQAAGHRSPAVHLPDAVRASGTRQKEDGGGGGVLVHPTPCAVVPLHGLACAGTSAPPEA